MLAASLKGFHRRYQFGEAEQRGLGLGSRQGSQDHSTHHFDRISNTSLTCGGKREGMSVLDATIENFEVDGDQEKLEVEENPELPAWVHFCSHGSDIRFCLQVAGVH